MIRLIALAAVLAFASPASAATHQRSTAPPPVCEQYDDIHAIAVGQGFPVTDVPDNLVGDLVAALGLMGTIKATRAFVISGSGVDVVGLEVDGCILPPIPIPSGAAPAVEHKGGRQEDGSVWA